MAETRRDLLDAICRMARAAGTLILEVYDGRFEVQTKADRSPVTLADERAEQLILASLAELAPEIPVIAEERAAREGLPERPPGRFWLVDPLDGTREFVKRNGEFTVNIALVEGDRPVLGVVHVPVLDTTYAGHGAGTATRRIGAAAALPIAARPVPKEGALVVHSRSHGDEARLAEFAAALPGAVRRVSGSSVKFCLIAAGEADYYPRFGPTMEWDTAAGQAVLEAAGGEVLATQGGLLRYAKPGFRNGAFIARGLTG